jgi:hypothetical protein
MRTRICKSLAFGIDRTSNDILYTVTTMKLCIQFLLCLMAASAVNSFAPKAISKNNNGALKAAVDDALAIYQKKHPKKAPKDGKVSSPTFSDRDEKYLKAGFKELAKAYGEDSALQMVKDLPICLAFNRKNFGPSLIELAKTFGDEEARGMVQRNPGLLVIPPTGAGGANSVEDLAMQFSYVVAATRPVGPFLLYGTLSLLFEPAFELISGMPLKENLAALVGL